MRRWREGLLNPLTTLTVGRGCRLREACAAGDVRDGEAGSERAGEYVELDVCCNRWGCFCCVSSFDTASETQRMKVREDLRGGEAARRAMVGAAGVEAPEEVCRRARFVGGEPPRACWRRRWTVDLGRLQARAAERMEGRGEVGEVGAESIARQAATRFWRNASSSESAVAVEIFVAIGIVWVKGGREWGGSVVRCCGLCSCRGLCL